MLRSFVYPLVGNVLLQSLSIAGPLNPPNTASNILNIGGHMIQPNSPPQALQDRGILDIFGIGVSDGGRWPPDPQDFPWPANISSHANSEAGPNDMPPNIDAQNEDGEVHTYKEITKAFMSKSCNETQRKQVLDAWEEARTLADHQTSFEFGFDYDIPHKNWLGEDWNSESSWIPWRKDFRKRNVDNWGRLRTVFSQNAPKNDYIYFYCHDWANLCKDDKGEADAYTQTYNGHILWWNNHYVTFCEKWFKRKTVAATIEQLKNSPQKQKVIDYFQATSGGILLHELWHMSPLVSQPKCLDYTNAFDAQKVWDLAKNSGTWWATENAESYHLDAIAIYVQQTYKSPKSPVPLRELKNQDAEAFAAVENDPLPEPYMSKFAMIDDNNPPPEAMKRDPDPAQWEEVTRTLWKDTPDQPPPPPEPTKSLSIVSDFKPDLSDSKLHWGFFQTNLGTAVDCRTDPVATFDQDIDTTQAGPFYPTGNFKMNLFGEDCEYQSGDKNPGVLNCNGFGVPCRDDPADQNPSDPKAEKGNHPCGDLTRQPVFLCVW